MDSFIALDLIKNKDPSGLEFIISEYGSLVKFIIRQILGTNNARDVEECTNDVWLTIWQKATQYDPNRSSIKTWLCVIARNKSIDQLRTLHNEAQKVLTIDEGKLSELYFEMTSISAIAEEHADIEHSSFILNKALAMMSDNERQLLIRRYYYFEDISSIAASYHVSRASIDNRLARSRKHLRKLLGEVIVNENTR